MVHFLRNRYNETIIECEVTPIDLSAVVNIEKYSIKLLSIESEKDADDFMQDISTLSEIRGWWWEKEKDFGDWSSIDSFVATKFKEISEKWQLYYITD